jgi:pimeloyl-ACP methyl ester carboxylesterase
VADHDVSDDDATRFPGARRPARQRWVSDHGLRLSVSEWGDEDAPPLLLAHGGFDFAGTFDGFAPLLADGGWRVVCWDQRGHGDSDHSVLYSWEADARDALAVLDSTTRRPVPFIGHSKGGGVLMQLADGLPHRCTHLVNLDGLPSRRNWPDVPDHERRRLMAGELQSWLDHHAGSSVKERRPGTIDELAERRQRMNPRLTTKWLRYLVPIGAQRADGDGDLWRWKLDPILRFGGFGPWRPEWSMLRMPGLAMPVLGVLGLQSEPMGWGTQIDDVEPYLPPDARFFALEDSGHFVHIEQPARVADLVLDFLGPPPAPGGGWGPVGGGTSGPGVAVTESNGTTTPAPVRQLSHGRARLALHDLRVGEGRPLLLLHGLGERAPVEVAPYLDVWHGPIAALDFTGHGLSTIPRGGGYTAEVLLADADAALRAVGQATVLGRGLGAYVALLLAGARPDLVCGAILTDGAGILGGGNGPGSPLTSSVDTGALAPPDPFALVELARDLRPPDYATSFARLATQASPLDQPIAVAAVNRPEWLEAVIREPGVVTLPLAAALALYGDAEAAPGGG